MKFLLNFLYYLYNYYMVYVLFSHTYHVTHHVMQHYDTLFMWLWLCDTCDMTLSHILSCVISLREKEKEKKYK